MSNISAMRESVTNNASTGANGMSEVANAELSCYGVFRKLETEDDARLVDDGAGGGECVMSRRHNHHHHRQHRHHRRSPTPPPSTTSASSTSTVELSPQEFAFAFGGSPVVVSATVGASTVDDDDDDDFDRRTYLVYDNDDGVGSDNSKGRHCCDTTTTTTAAADCRRCYRIGDLVWDDYGRGAGGIVDSTAGDPGTVGVKTAVALPFSHTPMGSTTKLVGLDAGTDDTPKVSETSVLYVFPPFLPFVSTLTIFPSFASRRRRIFSIIRRKKQPVLVGVKIENAHLPITTTCDECIYIYICDLRFHP